MSRKGELIHLMEIGMQFSDDTKQKSHDVRALFDHAVENKVLAILGSEAGGAQSEDLRNLLREEGRASRFRVRLARGDSWIAVDQEQIEGPLKCWYDNVLDPQAGVGRHTNRGVLGVEFDHVSGEHITLLTSHYLTKGSPVAGDKDRRVNIRWNRLLADSIGAHAKMKGDGRGLVFYGGDQNIVDRKGDTFFGRPLTSCWDELDNWPNTGHGNIDVIASYNKDKRVKCVDAWTLADNQLQLHTDHFLVEAIYKVED